MPYHCVAYGCGKTAEDGVTLFKFPKDPEEFRKWEKQVQRTRSQWFATPSSHLCNEHFGKEYFETKTPSGSLRLRPGAAPTVFVRPHCSSCNGVGCSKCLPAIQCRGITSEPKEHSVPSEFSEMAPLQFDDANRGVDTERPVICEMCGTKGNVGTFFSKSKRFCSISCSRSYSSNSKKSSILARLQTRALGHEGCPLQHLHIVSHRLTLLHHLKLLCSTEGKSTPDHDGAPCTVLRRKSQVGSPSHASYVGSHQKVKFFLIRE